jgi:hypothetical protein
MKSEHSCQSCGMPIEAGPYCQYCADGSGTLHGFEETVVRMGQFLRRQTPGLSDAETEKRTLDYMASMPAWREHPELQKRRR